MLLLSIALTAKASFRCDELVTQESSSSGFQELNPVDFINSEKLGYKPTIRPTRALNNGALTTYRIQILDEVEAIVGEFDYSLSKDGTHLTRVNTEVKVQARGAGLATALFAQALKDNPQVQSVEAQLAKTNAFEVTKNSYSGMSLEEAVRQSPTGKMLRRFGFTEAVEIENVGMFESLFFIHFRKP